MVRSCVAFAVLVAFSGVVYADEPQGPTASAEDIVDIAKRAQFDTLVMKGDQERARGRLTEAATAYAEALAVRREPLIAGRLGVLLVQLGRLQDAPDLLMDALHRDVEATPEERLAFLKAYDIAKAEGAWIEVIISHVKTTLTLDGAQRNRQGHSSVFMFVLAGDHELRATLKGYKDAIASIHVIKGEKSRQVFLTLEALPDPTGPVAELLRTKARVPIESAEDPPPDEPEKTAAIQGGVDGGVKPEKPRIGVSAGPVVVFGVASWQPAVGAVAGVSWRPKDYFSLGLEGRAAWLTSGVAGGQIKAMTVGGIARACGHWRWLFGCALGHLGVVNVDFSSASYEEQSYAFVKPGGGARVGASFRVGSSFVVEGSMDLLAVSQGTRLVAGQTIVLNQGPLMFGTQVLGGWEF